jgi:protein subunit release factor A
MCLPCKSDKMRIRNFMENRMTGYPIKFDQNEIEELKKK